MIFLVNYSENCNLKSYTIMDPMKRGYIWTGTKKIYLNK